MTLDEAIDKTFSPIAEIFKEAIKNASTVEELKEIEDALSKVSSDKEYGMSDIALTALKHPPNMENRDKALRLINSDYKGNLDELMKNREAIRLLLQCVGEFQLWCFGWKWLAEQFMDSDMNAHKPWSAEEDNELIECICNDMPEVFLAAKFKRSPNAIKTRVSTLVGKKRISQKVAGKFIGKVNGKQTVADLLGTVYRK